MTVYAVLAAVAALAVALVALLRLEQQRKARALLVSARVEQGSGGSELVVEVVNSGSGAVTVSAVWLWISTDKRLAGPGGPGSEDDVQDWESRGSLLELTKPRMPVEVDGGGWQAWRVTCHAGAALESESTRGFVKVYLKPGGSTSAPVMLTRRSE